MNSSTTIQLTSPANDKNGKPLKRGDIVKYGDTEGCRYRVMNAFENAAGITQIQVEPMTAQAHMYVYEKDIELYE
jgi:hypothetical protein